MTRRWKAPAVRTAIAVGLACVLLAPPAADATGHHTTPSRHDVQQARQKTADKAGQVAAVKTKLLAAEQQLQQAQVSAEQAAEAYNQARWELAQATQAVDDAQARAQAIQGQLQQQREGLAAAVVQSYEGGGQLVALQSVFSPVGPQAIMSQYASDDGVSSALLAGHERLVALSTLANLYQQQAQDAEATQSHLTDQARTALLQAQQAEADASVVSEQVTAERDHLTAQLARLQGISTHLAAERQRALARKAARAAARDARRQQQPTGDGGSTGSPGPITGPLPGPLPAPGPPDARASRAVTFAEAQLGDPYVYGAAGPNTWDCSGLVMGAWGAAGVSLPHSAYLQYALDTPIAEADLQPGDLVFWSSDPRDPRTIYHVAIYIGSGKIIQAPRPGENVEIVPLHYWIPPTYFARV